MAGERAAGGGRGKILRGRGVLGGVGVEMEREDDAVVKLWEGKQRRGCSLRSVRGRRKVQQGWGVMGVFGLRPGSAREIKAMGKGKSGNMAGSGRQGKESDRVCVYGAEGVEKEGIGPCLGDFQDPETLWFCPADLSGIRWVGHKPGQVSGQDQSLRPRGGEEAF